MTRRWMLVAAALLVVPGAHLTHASDRVGVYALVDKVVLEPATGTPERIQIWGVFALAAPNDLNAYGKPQRGYLYFTLPRDADEARAEWNDIAKRAWDRSRRHAIAFGNRFDLKARVRPAEEKPANPDPYTTGLGVVTLRSDTEYTPIRSLFNR